MADPLHVDPSRHPDAGPSIERDTKIEHLLLAGLDCYFAGEYDRAISVWTRVLFLDRGHARARAYIERARSAVAERQRESEELLHRGVAAFNQGETRWARELLTSAVEGGGPQEVALAFLERLDRLEAGTPSAGAPPEMGVRARRAAHRATGSPRRTRYRWALPLVIVGAVLIGGLYLFSARDVIAGFVWSSQRWGQSGRLGAPLPEEPLPLPASSEIVLTRARTLAAAGHLRDALRVLDGVTPADPFRTEADRLRSSIQQTLLMGAGVGSDIAATPPGQPGAGMPPPVRVP
jgi:hypothetical protein